MSPHQHVDRADDISMFLESAFHTLEPGLRLAIFLCHMPADRTGPARVLRRHGDEIAAVSRLANRVESIDILATGATVNSPAKA